MLHRRRRGSGLPSFPAALMPWQVAQFAAKSFWPSCTVACEALDVSADAVLVKSA